jgi:hypothetical protein
MSTTTAYHPRHNPIGGVAHAWWWRFARPHSILALVVAAAIGGNAALQASRSPGQVIRSELVAAAAELASPAGPYPTEASTRAIRRHFSEHSVALQTDSWPLVSATLQHLDKATCVDASTTARRMEGLVVVELDGYRSAEDCGTDNAMTWRILP